MVLSDECLSHGDVNCKYSLNVRSGMLVVALICVEVSDFNNYEAKVLDLEIIGRPDRSWTISI